MSKNVGSNKKCEKCSTLITKKYGSGRFCGQSCARSFATSKSREEINKKVSETLSGRRVWPDDQLDARTAWAKKWAKIQREEKLTRNVKINGDVLDITYGELAEYRKKQPTCEMCSASVDSSRNAHGKNLVIDHDHTTKKFRGLLCISCNRFLGYYENSGHLAKEYLERVLV